MMKQVTSVCLLAATTLLIAIQVSPVQGQQDFTTAQIPNPFRVGNFYPPRPEVEVCRPIRDYIDRNSARFTNELVTNTNADITFSTADSRIMSSRMQSRLNSLATLYRQQANRRMTVLRAWTQFPNSQVNDDTSLHYEGRTVQVRLPSGSNYDQFLQLAVQAAFDWVYFERQTLVRLSVIPTNCDRNVDCVFVLDRSGSVGPTNHGIAIQFIQNIVAFFSIGLNQTRVGFVAYSSSARTEFDLNDYTTLNSLTNRIGNVRYTGGGTGTGRALDLANNILNPANNFGVRPDDDGVPKIVVLITDGRSHDNVVNPSNRLKNAGVIVYAVGIGRVDVNELRDISSDPDDEHVFVLNSFRDAAGFVDFLSVTTCETPAIINPDGNVTTTIPPGGLEYFQTECPTYTDMVLVELTDLNGTNFLYASATEDNPGPLTQNTIRNETLGVTRRTLTLSIPSGSNVVYIGVQGQAEQNAFNIIVWDQLFDPSDVNVDILEGGSGRMEIYNVAQNLVQRAMGISLRYSIIEGNEAGLFTIQNGRVSVINAAQLNPNTQEFHNLTVLAQHPNINCQRSRTRISVRVFSNRITFGQVSPVTISENAATGSRVATISASGGRGPIQFSITGGNAENRFRIDPSTGRITLARTLNYETTETYLLTVRAQTNQGGTVTENTQQRVNVGDVNEAPTFVTACARSGSCAFSITEGVSVGTGVDTILADDPDLSTVANGMLNYRFQPQTVPFSVNSAGRITTTGAIDRETRDTYTMTLLVSDSREMIQTSVVISVNDIDDNNPVFNQAPSSIQVQENSGIGLEIAQYIATDNDVGANAAINYVITSGSSDLPFQINVQTGVLSVNGSIDFETRQSYTITVTARNPNNLSSAVSQTTTINIVNLNDNRPQFSQNPYTQNLVEDTQTNFEVITVEATDNDRGTFGDVTYSITDGNFQDSFRINSASGAIITNIRIDREVVSSFSLTVQARDQGGRRSSARVDITITDINDNSPMFVNIPYLVQVREDVSVPFEVLQVTAIDEDEPGNVNSQITYTITGGNVGSVFVINASTGQISTAQSLDFETRSSYTLNLRARDGGSPSNTAATIATINVLNVNENPPSLSGDQSVNISESASMGSVVAAYTALDPDMNTVTFSIPFGNVGNTFSIDSTGRITLATTLDYETRSNYVLTIQASDNTLSTTAILNVTVLDENEFVPVFMGETTFSVDEEQPDGTIVGTVLATDADGDPMNNQITYSFVQSSNYFTIGGRTGRIRTSSVLDREMLAQVFTPDLRLDVTARDSASPSRQTTTSITITLADINDNPPIFADSMYENSLLENLPAGQTVFQVSATDIDLGTNAEINYSFVLNENTEDTSLFTVDSSTGVLSTTGTLDCERQTSYSFTITATDSGTPSRSSTAQGTLTVLDENDNNPIFSINPYVVSVLESSQIDSILLTVSATDRDKEQNGQVRYSVINVGGLLTSIEGQGDEFTLFAINETTGKLSHRTEFNYERAPQVNVTVIATDLGVPRRTSQATVVINVMNVDESAPRFISTSCPDNVFVVEEVELNSIISRCTAEDPDNVTTASSPAAVTYRISAGNGAGVFTIDETTGDIRNTGRLDRDSQQSYALVIVATDLAGLRATRTVNIGLRDINDNAPQFGQNSYSYSFTDVRIQSYTQQIVRVTAIDRDSGNNGTVRYSLGQQVERNGRQTIITIIASDMGTPEQSNSATLTVTFERSCLLQEYEIDPLSGQVTAFVLCGIEIQPSLLNVSLASSSRANFNCSISHNSRMSYQWVHNGSLITLPTFFQERSAYPVNYTLTNARFEQAGEYACKATTQAGSLQTASSSVKIRVAPTITNPPEDAVVKAGETATFRCVGSGIPTPAVKWYDEFGNFITNGTTLTRENVQPTGRNPTFICIVNSDAGMAQKAVTLTVYVEQDVIEIDVDNLNNPIPSDDGGCQFVNKTQIEDILQTTTKRDVSVTRLQGENICEQTACLPNPCQNGGACSLSDTEELGYVCACTRGYVGRNCNEDRNECTDDPCFDGTCVNTNGEFQCQCTSASTGHLCQYSTDCQDPNTCSDGTMCVSTLDQSYICRMPPVLDESVVITGNITEDDLGMLNDLMQAEVEKYLAARANAPSQRRKRQTSGATTTTLATSCEPRFVQPDAQEEKFFLIWLCPVNVTEPTPQDQAILCSVLLQSPRVATCQPPGGSEMTLPTVPPPKETSVKISVVLVDNSGKPLDALDSEKEIEESGSLEVLKETAGLQIASVSPLNLDPRQQQTQEGPAIGPIVGAVVGTILVLVLVTAAVIAVLIFVRRRRDVEDRQQQQRRVAVQMLEKETGTSSDGVNGGGGLSAAEAVFTSSVDNLLSGQSTEESTYDSLQPQTKEQESTYDTLQPQKKVLENDYDVLPRKINDV